jgi:ATP-dependent Clp protease ATP-binding subunit ClpC
MFERFTDRARRVVVQAQEEARALANDHVRPEHVLLGLVHEGGGVAAKALESLGIGLETVRERVENVSGQGAPEAPSERIPFAEETKDLLKLSLRESLDLSHHYIGTEHLLLAVLRQADSMAARVLTDLGADRDRVRQEVIRLLAEYERRHGGQTG